MTGQPKTADHFHDDEKKKQSQNPVPQEGNREVHIPMSDPSDRDKQRAPGPMR